MTRVYESHRVIDTSYYSVLMPLCDLYRRGVADSAYDATSDTRSLVNITVNASLLQPQR